MEVGIVNEYFTVFEPSVGLPLLFPLKALKIGSGLGILEGSVSITFRDVDSGLVTNCLAILLG